jgi:hypothetical protein
MLDFRPWLAIALTVLQIIGELLKMKANRKRR